MLGPYRNDSSEEISLVTYEHCYCLLLLFTPEYSFAHSHLCLPAAVGYLGVTQTAAQELLLSMSKLPYVLLWAVLLFWWGWNMTHEPELRVLIQMPSDSLGGFV